MLNDAECIVLTMQNISWAPNALVYRKAISLPTTRSMAKQLNLPQALALKEVKFSNWPWQRVCHLCWRGGKHPWLAQKNSAESKNSLAIFIFEVDWGCLWLLGIQGHELISRINLFNLHQQSAKWIWARGERSDRFRCVSLDSWTKSAEDLQYIIYIYIAYIYLEHRVCWNYNSHSESVLILHSGSN